jgi:ABC-type sugar transport system ATPase subunit
MLDGLDPEDCPHQHPIGVWVRRRCVTFQKCYVIGATARSIEQTVGNLSGGHQQRTVFAKWSAAEPRLLLLDEPTRGINVNAKSEIYKMIDEIAAQGLAVLMVSSELPELIGMSDRIYAMRGGTLVAELTERKAMTQAAILAHILLGVRD